MIKFQVGPISIRLSRYRFFFLILVLSASFSTQNSHAQIWKPGLGQLEVGITEFRAPSRVMLSPFLAYDAHRDAVWSGDISNNGSRLVEFSLRSHVYTVHALSGNAIPTHVVLDSKNTVWYLDPYGNMLGHYYPDNGSNNVYQVPTTYESLGMALDPSDNVWIITTDSNHVLEFDSATQKFHSFNLPPTSTTPYAITLDKASGKIWIGESMEKMVSIEPQNQTILEYDPKEISTGYPVVVLADPSTGKIYFSEHDLYDVKVLDPKDKDLTGYSVDFGGYPTGLAFDRYGHLWVSQHTLDKAAVIDTSTGRIRQFDLPQGSLVQWLTAGPNGNILFLDYGSNSIGMITISSSDQIPQIGHIIPMFYKILSMATRIFSSIINFPH